MLIATIDFMKAFHSISHNSVWDAFKTCGVEQEYISFLKKTVQRPRSNSSDCQRERYVRDQKEDQAG